MQRFSEDVVGIDGCPAQGKLDEPERHAVHADEHTGIRMVGPHLWAHGSKPVGIFEVDQPDPRRLAVHHDPSSDPDPAGERGSSGYPYRSKPGAVMAVERIRSSRGIFSIHSSSVLIEMLPTENREGLPEAVCDWRSVRSCVPTSLPTSHVSPIARPIVPMTTFG